MLPPSYIPALFNWVLRNIYHKVSIRGVFLFHCLVPMDSDLHLVEKATVICAIFLVPRNFAAADLFGSSWQLYTLWLGYREECLLTTESRSSVGPRILRTCWRKKCLHQLLSSSIFQWEGKRMMFPDLNRIKWLLGESLRLTKIKPDIHFTIKTWISFLFWVTYGPHPL